MPNGDQGQQPQFGAQPAQGQPPDVPTQQQSTTGLADQWRSWISDPHNRAAMIQFGVALSQPMAAGQNWMGQIGSALGQAGEASDRVTAAEQKQQEIESKETLREAQASSAESRATTAATRASEAATLLKMREMEAEDRRKDRQNRRVLGAFGAKLKAQKQYYERALVDPEFKQQNPDFEQYYQKIAPKGVDEDSAPAPQQGVPQSNLLEDARTAIARGAPRDAVINKLRELGGDPSKL